MFTPFLTAISFSTPPSVFFSTAFLSTKYVIYLFVNYLPIQVREYGHLFMCSVSEDSTWRPVKRGGLLYLQSEP